MLEGAAGAALGASTSVASAAAAGVSLITSSGVAAFLSLFYRRLPAVGEIAVLIVAVLRGAILFFSFIINQF